MFQFHLMILSSLFAFWLLEAKVYATPLPTTYNATLIKVIDGDTFRLKLELYPDLYKEVNLRISGIDTPESRNGVKGGEPISQCEIALGKKAKEHAKQVLEGSASLTVSDIDPDKTKYAGRINGKLWFVLQDTETPTATDFGLYMIKQGLATQYNGGTRQPWPCE